MKTLPGLAFGTLLLAGGAGSLGAQENIDDGAGIAFFESDIRPVLIEHCYECHSAKADKAKGGLLLDSRDNIRKGGDNGPAVVPNDLEASLLLTAISHADPDLEMPPKKAKLPDRVIASFRRWIEMGAPDSREGTTTLTERPPTDLQTGREFWAFQSPAEPGIPETTNPAWAKRDLDHFILHQLEANGMSPSPDADPATLLRRLHFDLVGLPPSPETIRRFLDRIENGALDEALEDEIGILLDSRHFGERWGRHWLDVARFAESNGKESNVTYPHAWRYRDYVIDAFNADIPYNRFLTEQIAGDLLLPAENDAERARLLIATGFLAIGAKGLNEQNKFQFLADTIDEQLDALTRGVMASSIACARCHDHKFDPFHMEDYYALAGIFLSTETRYGTWVSSEVVNGGRLIRLPDFAGQLIPSQSMTPEELADLNGKLAVLNQEEKDLKEAGKMTLRDALRIIWVRGGLVGRLETIDEDGNAVPLAMGVLDRDQIMNAPLLERGEIAKPGPKVPRDFPRVIDLPGVAKPAENQSGRLELARWLTHPEHPLTARVMANRVWRHLFGEGIVATVDNFGFNGERPSHPELLDHLALKFVEGGWSVKKLIREIALSRSYRQRSTWREDYFQKDPDNRLLWRAAKRRLDAECIRDAMLAVSGNLDPKRRPGSLISEVGDKSVSLFGFDKKIPADLDGSHHRSVYLPAVRDRLPDVLELFDFAEPSLVTGDRDTTNVPLQALYLMNGPFVRGQAAGLARKIESTSADSEEQVRQAFLLCFGRDPDEFEMGLSLKSLADSDSKNTLTNFCQSLLSAAEFRNLD